MAFFDTTWYVNYGDGSTTGYYAVPVWPGALAAVTAGTWCRQLATPTVGNERCFVCVDAGTTGAAEPVWVVTRGADSAANIDGTVKWMECTGMAGPCGDLTNAPVWVASRVLTLGEVYYDSVSGSLQACTTAGTSKTGAAPTFSATAGVTTTDNTVTWTSLGPTSNYTTAFKYPHNRLKNALTATWGAAGNSFAVSSIHAETQAAANQIIPLGTPASPQFVYCISNSTTLASPTLATSATITTTGNNALSIATLAATVAVYIYGLGFVCGSGATQPLLGIGVGGTSDRLTAIFESCSFVQGATGAVAMQIAGGAINNFIFNNCSWVFGNTGSSITIANNNAGGNLPIEFHNNTFAGTGSVPTTLFSGGFQAGQALFLVRNSDLSKITGTLISNNSYGNNQFQNCKLGVGVVVASNVPTLWGGKISLSNCDSSATNYRYFMYTYAGTVQQETTIVRTSSLASDGTTPISWHFTTTATSNFSFPLISEEISIWNDLTGSLRTATFYLISNTTLTNQDFWVEVEYPSSASNPLGATVNSRMALLGTPAALSSDTSTWGGSTNKYTIALTFTPQAKGPIKARFYYAKASTTTYVDHYIYIT